MANEQQQKQPKGNHIHTAAGRVVQLDAWLLDETLIALFGTRLDEIVRHALPADWHHSETWWWLAWLQGNNAGLFQEYLARLAYFVPQIIGGQTPGQRLMNIRYGGNFTLAKGVLNFLLGHLLPTTLDHLSHSLASSSSPRRALVDRLGLALKLANFLHFFVLLNRGGPARVVERVVRLAPVYDQIPSLGQLNYGALHREMLGHSFAQLVTLLGPILAMIRRRLDKMMAKSADNHRNNSRMMEEEGHSSSASIVCAECSQKAVCVIRAKRKGRGRRRTTTEKEDGAEWNDQQYYFYCYLCYVNGPGHDGAELAPMIVGEGMSKIIVHHF